MSGSKTFCGRNARETLNGTRRAANWARVCSADEPHCPQHGTQAHARTQGATSMGATTSPPRALLQQRSARLIGGKE